ncbi:hypothetical protein RHMOL_Rhmol02G0239400 [Rhododendron molle]|uniref:Uncharacterized protein n=1 Tax=Rhododendron molle TaxID=49168 RepID=A0ACC0PVY6_RHOML|nr:hypothetical protein RHMOL_Rhmol02G0239400 [Rhododendron molle]
MVGGPPEMSWKIPVVDRQGNPAEIHLVPARVEPPSVTVSVPNEWVNEAIRCMLAMENVIKRAASGLPLELRYPAPSPPRAQNAAAQRPQTRSSQPAPAGEEAARQVVARAELQYQIKVRETPSQEEGRAQKRPRLILPEISEEEEEKGEDEEEEEHSSARSDSDDSVDDPPYKISQGKRRRR